MVPFVRWSRKADLEFLESGFCEGWALGQAGMMNVDGPEWTHWDQKVQRRPVNLFRNGGNLRDSYGRPEEKVLINRHEVTISRDAWDMQEFITYMYIKQLLRHPAFQTLLALLLVANAITIAARTNIYLGQQHYELFSAIDDIVLTILLCEVLLGWFNGFWIFWKDGWNILNFIIVLVLVLSLFFEVFNAIAIVYTLRVLRLVHVCMAVEPLARILRVIIQSIPDMANIMALILFFMLVFSVFGVTLFGSMVPKHFQNMKVALYTLFICITQDGWVDIYQEFQMDNREYGLEIGGAVYFAVFITLGAFIGINLLVVVVTTNLEEMMKEREREQQQEVTPFTILEVTKDDYTSDEKPELQLVHCRDCLADWVGAPKQEPLAGGPMQNLNENTCDNFCLVLEGIQENLQAYKEIREELNKIVEEVRSIRFNQEQEEEMLHRRRSRTFSGESATSVQSQDILSRLINKEKLLEEDSLYGTLKKNP